jgi:hypothetical protein
MDSIEASIVELDNYLKNMKVKAAGTEEVRVDKQSF